MANLGDLWLVRTPRTLKRMAESRNFRRLWLVHTPAAQVGENVLKGGIGLGMPGFDRVLGALWLVRTPRTLDGL